MSAFVIPIAIMLLLVLLNGLFVAAEFAIISVRPTRIDTLAEQGNRTARSIKQVLDNPVQQDRYIATAQLGITLASLGLGMYGEHTIAAWLLGPLHTWLHLSAALAHTIAIVAAIALLTFAHVVIGEMVPKSLALQYSERTALRIASIMALMKKVFYPLVVLLNAIGNGVLWLLGIPTTMEKRVHSPTELAMLVAESHAGGLLTGGEDQLLQNIFDFGERRVGQVMTPRPRMTAIPIDSTEDAVWQVVDATPYSRFPVYDGDLDHIVGVLLVKELARSQLETSGRFDLTQLVRPISTVPETLPVEAVLAMVRRAQLHMVVVIDEYGGTAGIVTLEDVVEEVVGEIQDEFDHDELPPLQVIAPGVVIARGDLLLDDLCEAVPLDLRADEMPAVETVGGVVLDRLGRPPQVGDQIDLYGATFTVERVAGRAAWTVRITYPVDERTEAHPT